MAVYTQVSDQELNGFLSSYDVGNVLSFKGIAEGVENSNFLLRTSKASFILTLYEKRVHEEDLPFFLGLMNHMATRGVSCPLPVAAQDGRFYRTLNGRPAALITFLDGVSVKVPNAAQCEAAGAALANFHLASADFELTRANSLGIQDWRPLYNKCAPEANAVVPGMRALIAEELTALEEDWPEGLPQGVIHADLFPDNVFFLDDRLSGIIDFYFACNDSFAYDLSVTLNAWCFDDTQQFEPDKARALLCGYDSVRQLTREERKALPLLSRGSAMRFLLTRLHDWIFHPDGALVDPKDPKEFLARLEFHRQNGNQLLGLLP
ncbi:MAG: homoserine kinase [Alphaproteobacteria bacterium]|nr:MAG: homoserine kinase [Alphaproteobacteria bacterium]